MTTVELTDAEIEAFGAEMDAIREAVLADLGDRDVEYLRRVIRVQRGLEVAGRGLLMAGFLPPAWAGGVVALSLAKILDNMEIGHNVMHGQYDWTRDPALSSQQFEWDTVCPAHQWRHSHNYLHHTFTNIVGKDRDVGYGVLRMADDEEWKPRHLANPLIAGVLALLFEWGVMLHDLEVERLDDLDRDESRRKLAEMWAKARGQLLKDYVLFPLLAGPGAPLVLAGNVTANLVRNVWAFTIIFCGHFPDGVVQFSEDEVADETKGGWYVRQLLGSANLTGGKLFHILTGNLSHQIEHHLFPDLPAHRYAEISEQVREACDRYGLPYNTGGLAKQFGGVVRRIVRLALPPRPDAPEPVRLSVVPTAQPVAA